MNSKSFDVEKAVIELVMTDNMETKKQIAKQICEKAEEKGIYPASIHEFYMARGRNEFQGFTVPAMNLRALTYDLACAIFRVAKKHSSGAFIFEIAKSEIGYTDQPPVEFASMILAAAIKENYSGPVFIQGDHFQLNAAKFKENPDKEIEGVKKLIKDSIDAGFYNIDIDSSTLVDLSKPTIKEQQRLNYEVCAKLTQFIRSIEPKNVTVSVGGEIGEIGTQNSTPEDLQAYMNGLEEHLEKGVKGISKISVQTGTTHGGVVLPDGSIAQIKLDFNTLKTLSENARKEYGMAGAVQHGASTLPPEAFHKFVECETAEVHLATAFQNIIYESKHFPEDLRQTMYTWLKDNLANERKDDQTEEQFIYKTRKKAFGQFKKEIMALPQQTRTTIATELETQFEFLFKQLNVTNTKTLVEKYCTQIDSLSVTGMEIPFDDFMKLDLRVGEVEEATQVPKSRNLLKLIVDFGSEKRQCVAGLLQYYKPEELMGKKFVFILNLERRKLMGIESQCMALAAEDEEGNVTLVAPEKDISAGSRIR